MKKLLVILAVVLLSGCSAVVSPGSIVKRQRPNISYKCRASSSYVTTYGWAKYRDQACQRSFTARAASRAPALRFETADYRTWGSPGQVSPCAATLGDVALLARVTFSAGRGEQLKWQSRHACQREKPDEKTPQSQLAAS